MDSRTTNCFVLLLVILITSGYCAALAGNSTPAPGANKTNNVVTAAPALTGNPTPAPGANKTNNVVTAAPVQGANSPTNSPAATTKSPKHCIEGKCVAAGDDESCLGKVTGTCPFIGSCTKIITKNQTHSVFELACGKATCQKVASTTTVNPTPAAATPTTTSTCCTDALCNKFQPMSAGARFSTNVLYLGGILLLLALI
ncbi:uncharacterized protein LOC132714052 [Ruditapes philippinarum]|uniref:uncharacterized protein LOC132714052 n=1 Tax=Ruditapes philippinarum TaxID=129788 RepID=UPI00295A6AF1|nr:uncharacterized protein LOC132714052 [Ruditapes philippinarum]